MRTKAILLLSGLMMSVISDQNFDRVQITSALEKSAKYLERDGKLWFEGKLPVQERGCVSCHQVPSAIWSLASANRSLNRDPSNEFQSLFSDATDFVANKEFGRPAIWAQLLISESIMRSKPKDDSSELLTRLLPLILESQKEDGSWQAKGQFPYQRRPIGESDAVVTMWMLRAMNSYDAGSPNLESSVLRAQNFINLQDGESTEFLAWRVVTGGKTADGVKQDLENLISRQNSDGSWGWAKGEAGNAYSTGVALFALLDRPIGSQRNTRKAIQYLLQNQLEDGTWPVDSSLISKEGSTESLDYIYKYWSTAWATISLAKALKNAE